MIKAIPMEDWLRDCVYHDGRKGYVTLPTDKVLEIAEYIQLTRTNGTDGLLDINARSKDEPYIDIETGLLHWRGWKYRRRYENEPQTERGD